MCVPRFIANNTCENDSKSCTQDRSNHTKLGASLKPMRETRRDILKHVKKLKHKVQDHRENSLTDMNDLNELNRISSQSWRVEPICTGSIQCDWTVEKPSPLEKWMFSLMSFAKKAKKSSIIIDHRFRSWWKNWLKFKQLKQIFPTTVFGD